MTMIINIIATGGIEIAITHLTQRLGYYYTIAI